MLTLMSSKWTCFSKRHANTLDTAVESGGPYTFTGVLVISFGIQCSVKCESATSLCECE
ncbi:hypothetical protein SOVF_206540, partial [Spinacia oleracea]